MEMFKGPFEIIGAAYGLGSHEHGSRLGPHALRGANIVERLQRFSPSLLKGCDIEEPDLIASSKRDPKLLFLDEYLKFNKAISPKLWEVYRAGHRPLIIGGDHSVSFSTIGVARAFLKEKCGPDATLGVLWIDTHPDINTNETTVTGNIHGMMNAAVLGLGDSRLTGFEGIVGKILPEHLGFVGLRDIDPPERELIKRLKIKAFTVSDIDRIGIHEAMEQAIKHVAQKTTACIVSFDLDVCDPSIAPGVGVSFPGGLTYREVRSIMEMVSTIPNLLSLELMELNPELDIGNRTCALGIDLLEFALGKTLI